jgi:hypothetical protein
MPTPRKSIAELKLSGTYQTHKARYEHRLNPVSTVLSPIGAAPRHLATLERAVWAEVVKNAPEGLLGRPDRIVLEVASRLIVKLRTGEYRPSDVGALLNVLTKLGLTPAARRKLNLEPPVTVEPTTKSPWDELDELD